MGYRYFIYLSAIVVTCRYPVSSVEECGEDKICNKIPHFEFSLNVDGKLIELAWKFNESKPIFGFQAMIYSEDNEILYQSPLLHHKERKMNIEKELKGKCKICINVYENSTYLLGEKCEVVEISDFKIIIGILAGVVFIIPCIIGITYVIYKDYKNSGTDYEQLDKEPEESEKETEPAAGQAQHSRQCVCQENLAFVSEDIQNIPQSAENTSLTDLNSGHICKQTARTEILNSKKLVKQNSKADNKTRKSVTEADITDEINSSPPDCGNKEVSKSRNKSETDIVVGDLAGTHL